MRIAIISDCYPPHVGGIETQVEGLARHVARAGHRVEVITATAASGTVDVPRNLGSCGRLEVHRLALNLPGFVPINPFAAPQIRALVTRCDVVNVHVGVVSPFAQRALQLACKLGKPTVVTWHCMLDGFQTLLRASRIYANRRAAPVVHTAVSHALAQQVRRVTGEDVRVIPNGVALSKWRHIASCRNLAQPVTPPLRLVSAMRFMPRKRPLALVRVMRRVHRQLGQAAPTLTIYGIGPQLGAVRAAAKLARIDRLVKCPGKETPAGLQLAYLNSDAFILASTLESFGLAALEARSAGLPVLGRAGTGMEDFIASGVDGYLARSDKDLAAQLVKLTRSPDILEGYLRAASDSTGMSWQRTVRAALAAFEQVTG